MGEHSKIEWMAEIHEVSVSFDPLRIELPGAGPFIGEIHIVLPEHHYTVMDLSLGGIIPGAHFGADGRGWALKFAVGEPGMKAGDLLRFIEETEHLLKQAHGLIQEELDKRPLLGGLT